jgi:hypothetical protein
MEISRREKQRGMLSNPEMRRPDIKEEVNLEMFKNNGSLNSYTRITFTCPKPTRCCECLLVVVGFSSSSSSSSSFFISTY